MPTAATATTASISQASHATPAKALPANSQAGDAARRLRQGLTDALDRLATGTAPVVVAPPGELGARGGGHFHLVPELFLQLAGRTDFRFPQGSLQLDAGQAALLPPRLLHAERVMAGPAGQPFCNLVVQADGPRLTCHLAHEATPGQPGILHLEALHHPRAESIHGWLGDAARLGQPSPGAPWAAQQARGLVCAAVAGVLQLLDDQAADALAEPPRLARLRVLVQNQLGDAGLSVRGLALQSGCTADHLSSVFSQHSGEPLLAYINRLRLARAAHLLRDTGMAAKEVAWACGFATPSYFSRCFRQQHGLTPKAWRAAAGAKA